MFDKKFNFGYKYISFLCISMVLHVIYGRENQKLEDNFNNVSKFIMALIREIA